MMILVVVLFFCPLAGAEPTITSTSQEQRNLALTIYNTDLALIKDTRTVNLPQGALEMRFMDVAGKIDPTSVALKTVKADGGVSILEQNYEFDLITPAKLLDKNVGKELELVTYFEGKEVKREKAELLSTNSGNVFKIDGRVHLGHPGTVILPGMPADLNARPTLVWLLKSRDATGRDIEASYLTSGINWKCDYVALVNQKDTEVDVTGWVTINNESGATYTNADIKLIAGDVHRVVTQPPRQAEGKRLYAAMGDQAAAPQFEEKSFFEYHMYTLTRPATIKDKQIKQMTLLAAERASVKKGYTLKATPQFFWHPNPAKMTQKAEVTLELINSQKNHMGIPLPAGKVRVYKYDSDKSLQFIGEDRIDHTPKDEKVRLLLGKAFDIVGERTQTSFQKIAERVFEQTFEIEIRNHKDEEITVTVVEPMAGDWKITSQTSPWVKKDAFTAEFQLTVPKDGTGQLTYTVRTSQ
ncbi:MAG: DUF4139 domain-containing protein [Deltaproteobacteria bacterium]|nr:DUF4139 domain-containing protein [Deltaproteobacteria bacterium]